MQLVSIKTRSSLDGPFHESFRKFLVNGKGPITSFSSKFLSCALFCYLAIQRRTPGFLFGILINCRDLQKSIANQPAEQTPAEPPHHQPSGQ